MKDSLPSHVLNDKLPRFLQKCTEKFESDRRYRDDLRYLRVWLQLVTCLSIWVISISNNFPTVLLRFCEILSLKLEQGEFSLGP